MEIGPAAGGGMQRSRLEEKKKCRRSWVARSFGAPVPMHQPAPIHWSQNPIACAYVRVGCRKDKKTKRLRQEAKRFVHWQRAWLKAVSAPREERGRSCRSTVPR